jgi:4,5-DOPA dioxygenase extradiol
MIYDMGGFPPELYRVRYDAPGSREIANEIIDILAKSDVAITPDPTRGYDHGVWSTLVHLFPAADIPVIMMSLDYRATPRDLIELGESLAILRERGILIVGSGNIVHNLGAIDWSGQHIHPWATEFDARFAAGIIA